MKMNYYMAKNIDGEMPEILSFISCQIVKIKPDQSAQIITTVSRIHEKMGVNLISKTVAEKIMDRWTAEEILEEANGANN